MAHCPPNVPKYLVFYWEGAPGAGQFHQQHSVFQRRSETTSCEYNKPHGRASAFIGVTAQIAEGCGSTAVSLKVRAFRSSGW